MATIILDQSRWAPDFLADPSWGSDFPDILLDVSALSASASAEAGQRPASPGASAGVAKPKIVVALRDTEPSIESLPVLLLCVLFGAAMGSLPRQASASK